MKAHAKRGTSANDSGASNAPTTTATATNSNLRDQAGSKGIQYVLSLDLAKLLDACKADEGAELFRNLVRLSFRTVIHRNPGSKGALDSPAVDLESFTKAVLAANFMGDEGPTSVDKKQAERILASIAKEEYTAETAVKVIKDRYGWTVTPDKEGFEQHEFLKRKQDEAKNKGLADI